MKITATATLPYPLERMAAAVCDRTAPGSRRLPCAPRQQPLPMPLDLADHHPS